MRRGLDAVGRSLRRAGLSSVKADIFRGSVLLSGTVNSYEKKLEAGYCAAGKGFAAVVNDISVPGLSSAVAAPEQVSRELEGRSFDVAVIGGGVIGCSIARELSRYALTVALFEKEPDLAMHASGRNDGMIHDGFAAKPGSKKAAYNVRGNFLYTDLTRDLEVPFRRPGSLFLFRNPLMKMVIPLFLLRAKRNGVMSCRYLSRREVRSMEPNLISRQFGAFFIPTAGMLSPHELTLALAENAAANGVSFFRGTEVTGFSQTEAGISGIETTRGRVGPRL
jgi:glycerol-3-phosphate dehydrogenase